MKRIKLKGILFTAAIILLVAAGATAVGKKWLKASSTEKTSNKKTDEYETVSVMDESGIGAATEDDPWMEMEKLLKVYYGEDQVATYQGRMRLIDDNGEHQKLVEELEFTYSSFRQQYYYRMGQLECVKQDRFILLADHDSRTIAVSPVTISKDRSEGILGMEEFKKIIGQKSKGAKIMQNGEEKILTINNIQDPSIQGYQVYYDPKTYQVKKMLIGMIRMSPLEETAIEPLPVESEGDEKVDTEVNEISVYAYYLEVLYDKVEKTPSSEKDFKPEQKFIRFENKKPILQPAFSSYRLLN